MKRRAVYHVQDTTTVGIKKGKKTRTRPGASHRIEREGDGERRALNIAECALKRDFSTWTRDDALHFQDGDSFPAYRRIGRSALLIFLNVGRDVRSDARASVNPAT